MSEAGLEPLTSKQDQDLGSRQAKFGLKDTKKVIVLVCLVVVGGGVVAFQFLRGRSPVTAGASITSTSAVSPGATSVGEIDSVLQRLDTTSADPKQGDVSVVRVEQLVREFDGYIRQRQVPLSQLHANPFRVTSAKVEAKAETNQKEAAAAVAEEARRRQILEVGARLTLGSVLVSGEKRFAVVSGKVCSVGDVVCGFQVQQIEPNRVVLACEGETVTLGLFDATGSNK
ncbi:MAG: hypothetical protein WBD75_02080 [Phycisphaerae bacterium]